MYFDDHFYNRPRARSSGPNEVIVAIKKVVGTPTSIIGLSSKLDDANVKSHNTTDVSPGPSWTFVTVAATTTTPAITTTAAASSKVILTPRSNILERALTGSSEVIVKRKSRTREMMRLIYRIKSVKYLFINAFF